MEYLLMMYFARFGGHDAVKLVVRREPVDERNDDVTIEKQALPFLYPQLCLLESPQYTKYSELSKI